ncbi:MAG: hypothetical protein JWQ80_44 [Massilia sp.]|nr:hypothetical protein [Massilia sp.]
MLHDDIASLSLTHLSGLGLDPADRPDRFSFADTIKNTLVDGVVHKDILQCTSTELELSCAKSDYLEAVLTELHFGNIRIEEQCKNLGALIVAEAQPAWILVTTYYACYFMANDLAKASGQFIINISKDDFLGMLSGQPPSISGAMQVEGYTPFSVTVSHGEMSGEVNLLMRKNGSKPHQLAWHNFARLLAKLSVSDSRFKHVELLKAISLAKDGWGNPSDVRNTWNYTQSNYYGEKGRGLAKTFSSVIRADGSAFAWAGNNTLKPTEENVVASIAYLYHILRGAHSALIRRLVV